MTVRRMSILWIVLGLYSSQDLFADAINEDSVVKVYSGRCGDEESGFKGTGFLFRTKGEVYALTSEHVVLHSPSEYCHLLWNARFGFVKTELIAADWGYGLALLQVKDTARIEITLGGTEIFSHDSPSGTIATWGYVHGGKSLVRDPYGRVLVGKSQRSLIPFVKHVTEIIEAHGEFGMSGGPVTENASGKLVGLLSHQYIRKKPGGPATVVEWESDMDDVQSHLLVISAPTIRGWLAQILDKGEPVGMHRRASSQVSKGHTAIVFGPLCFVSRQGEDADPTDEIGGGDGVGAGGDEQGEGPNGKMIEVQISLCAPKRSFDHNVLPGKRAFFNHIYDYLIRRGSVSISYFIKYKADVSQLKKRRFKNLAYFVQLLADDSYTPVALLTGSGLEGDQNHVDAYVQNLKQSGVWFDSNLQDLLEDLQAGVDAGEEEGDAKLVRALGLIKQVMILSEMLKNGHWQVVPTSWVEGLYSGYEPAWQYLFNHHFDISVELYRQLGDVKSNLKRVKI